MQNIEMVRCNECGEVKPITDYPKASVGKGINNYYRVDHLGIPRRRNRCALCQKEYNRKAKIRQREREAEAIATAKAKGSKVAFIPMDDKAPRQSINGKVGNVRKINLT